MQLNSIAVINRIFLGKLKDRVDRENSKAKREIWGSNAAKKHESQLETFTEPRRKEEEMRRLNYGA